MNVTNSSYPQNRSTACGSYEGVQTIIGYIEKRLLLKVNQEKTKVGYIQGLKFLGSSFYIRTGKCRLSLHKQSLKKLKARLRELTARCNGMGYEQRKLQLPRYI
ncbi:MAG: hypothetical protein ACK5L5_06850, partial [Bacteroidales bacterium]